MHLWVIVWALWRPAVERTKLLICGIERTDPNEQSPHLVCFLCAAARLLRAPPTLGPGRCGRFASIRMTDSGRIPRPGDGRTSNFESFRKSNLQILKMGETLFAGPIIRRIAAHGNAPMGSRAGLMFVSGRAGGPKSVRD